MVHIQAIGNFIRDRQTASHYKVLTDSEIGTATFVVGGLFTIFSSRVGLIRGGRANSGG